MAAAIKCMVTAVVMVAPFLICIGGQYTNVNDEAPRRHLRSYKTATAANSTGTAAAAQSPPPGSEILQNPLSFLTDQPFNDFDWALAKALDGDVNDNFVISPISVKLAIGMLYLGVEGVAAKEIEKALRINASIKDNVIAKFSQVALSLERSKNYEYDLNVGTKLFADESTKVNDDYRKKLSKWFNSTVEMVDFKNSARAIGRVNKWCGEVTKGKINKLIDEGQPLDETTILLANAIYFRGEWETQFPIEATKMDAFWASADQKLSIPTMHVKSKYQYYNATELKFHLIRLPYVGKKFAMYLIVPYNVDGLPNLTKSMTPEGLAKSLKLMKECNINLSLPKFQFESTSVLVPVLTELGIKELFNPLTNLDKIGTSPNGPLTISNILQKSGIEVNEKGSVGYAATEIHIVSRFGEDIIDVEVNRPFAFLIADEEKDAIVFTGKVLNPAAEAINDRFASNSPPETPFDGWEAALKDRYYFFDKELLMATANVDEENVAYSPASIKTALALLLEGAGGRTAYQIVQALRLPENKEERIASLQKHQKALQQKSGLVTLESESTLFVAENEKLDTQYRQSIKDNYSAETKALNFANGDKASKVINDWIYNVTDGLISTLVKKDDFDASTKLFLGNCVYFKADWESQFDVKYTRQDCFYPKPGQCHKSYLMTGEKSVKYQYSKLLEAKIVELPFQDKRFSMVFVLPDKEDGLKSLIKNLQHLGMPAMLARMRKATVQLTIPRATVEFTTPLSKILQKFDIHDIFTSNANLSGIFQTQNPIYVRDIVHKSKIEINEKGAKAAAATGVQVVLLSAPIKYEFAATYPFLFFIRDVQLDGFLFEGVIAYPDKVSDDVTTWTPSSSTSIYSGSRRTVSRFSSPSQTSLTKKPSFTTSTKFPNMKNYRQFYLGNQ